MLSQLEKLLDSLKVLRQATIEVIETLDAWLRFRKSQRKSLTRAVENEKYSVFLATKGDTLIPSSEPMRSKAKKYCRPLLPPKNEIRLLHVGVFGSKAQAIKAFEDAYFALPTELRINPQVRLPRMLIGRRNCGKHRLIRCSASKVGPCEICHADNLAFIEMESKQFIWKGQSYLFKMNGDTKFLADNVVFQKFAPRFPYENNPLLLPDPTILTGLYESYLQASSMKPVNFKCVTPFTSASKSLVSHANSKFSIYDSFPLPWPTHDANDFLLIDRYNCQSIDPRLLSAQYFLFTYDGAGVLYKKDYNDDDNRSGLSFTHPVVAIYSFKGVAQAALQFRGDTSSHIDDSGAIGSTLWSSVSTIGDSNKWSSIVTKGRAVRSFELRERMKSIAHEILKEKKSVRASLRKILKTHIVDIDPVEATESISRGKCIRGGFVDYDTLRVENLLRIRSRLISTIIKFQSVWRSYISRIYGKREFLEIKDHRQCLINRIISIKKIANETVEVVVAMAMKNRIEK